mmetsp:Transcript_63070/g.144519  ORF Transcript_63070/g.144519 Transcript_63070/m.144519 type:complete len:252 (+) Transcript_63070:1-756(+)
MQSVLAQLCLLEFVGFEEADARLDVVPLEQEREAQLLEGLASPNLQAHHPSSHRLVFLVERGGDVPQQSAVEPLPSGAEQAFGHGLGRRDNRFLRFTPNLRFLLGMRLPNRHPLLGLGKVCGSLHRSTALVARSFFAQGEKVTQLARRFLRKPPNNVRHQLSSSLAAVRLSQAKLHTLHTLNHLAAQSVAGRVVRPGARSADPQRQIRQPPNLRQRRQLVAQKHSHDEARCHQVNSRSHVFLSQPSFLANS